MILSNFSRVKKQPYRESRRKSSFQAGKQKHAWLNERRIFLLCTNRFQAASYSFYLWVHGVTLHSLWIKNKDQWPARIFTFLQSILLKHERSCLSRFKWFLFFHRPNHRHFMEIPRKFLLKFKVFLSFSFSFSFLFIFDFFFFFQSSSLNLIRFFIRLSRLQEFSIFADFPTRAKF